MRPSKATSAGGMVHAVQREARPARDDSDNGVSTFRTRRRTGNCFSQQQQQRIVGLGPAGPGYTRSSAVLGYETGGDPSVGSGSGYLCLTQRDLPARRISQASAPPPASQSQREEFGDLCWRRGREIISSACYSPCARRLQLASSTTPRRPASNYLLCSCPGSTPRHQSHRPLYSQKDPPKPPLLFLSPSPPLFSVLFSVLFSLQALCLRRDSDGVGLYNSSPLFLVLLEWLPSLPSVSNRRMRLGSCRPHTTAINCSVLRANHFRLSGMPLFSQPSRRSDIYRANVEPTRTPAQQFL